MEKKAVVRPGISSSKAAVCGQRAQLASDRKPYPKKKYVFQPSSSVIDAWSTEMSWKLGRASR